MAEYIDRTQIKWYGCDHEGRACIPSGGHCEKCFFGTCNHDEVMNIKPADVVERSKVNAAIEGIKQLREQTRWIPVTERLPEEGQMVIACYPTDCGKRVMTAYYYKECGFSCGITYAWMPLPKPYKGGPEE